MGEIAEMILDGVLCQECGIALNGEAPGYPRSCHSCKASARYVREGKTKAKCPTCGKWVKAIGLPDHQRDAHGAQ